MPWEYREDGVTSDITFVARAASLADLFTDAAEATTNVMVDPLDSVKPRERREVSVRADSLDLLLRRFLDELVFRKDAEGLLLRASGVRVEQRDCGWEVHAILWGEPIAPARHLLGSDVKAVTLHGLAVGQDGAGWRAQVTLDV
jgi:SHS2 domain-containing protein